MHSSNIKPQATSTLAPESEATMEAQSPIVKCKVCITCQGLHPLSMYAPRKETKEGKFSACRACNNEAKRRRHEAAFGKSNRPIIDHGPQRNMHLHNRGILSLLMPNQKDTHIYGYSPQSSKVYKVVWSLTSSLLIPTLSLYDLNGNIVCGWSSNASLSEFTEHLLEYLKTHNIRLENNEGDIIVSKRVVYYINE